jgi:hypothetical protein
MKNNLSLLLRMLAVSEDNDGMRRDGVAGGEGGGPVYMIGVSSTESEVERS